MTTDNTVPIFHWFMWQVRNVNAINMLVGLRMKCDDEFKRMYKDGLVLGLHGANEVIPWQNNAPAPGLLQGIHRLFVSSSVNVWA